MKDSLISPLPSYLVKLLHFPQNNTPGFSWSSSCSAPASLYSVIQKAVPVSFETCELDYVTLLFKMTFIAFRKNSSFWQVLLTSYLFSAPLNYISASLGSHSSGTSISFLPRPLHLLPTAPAPRGVSALQQTICPSLHFISSGPAGFPQRGPPSPPCFHSPFTLPRSTANFLLESLPLFACLYLCLRFSV